MSSRTELRAFMNLLDLFRERNWPSPLAVEIQGEMTGFQLLTLLDIPPEERGWRRGKDHPIIDKIGYRSKKESNRWSTT